MSKPEAKDKFPETTRIINDLEMITPLYPIMSNSMKCAERFFPISIGVISFNSISF